MGEGIFNKFKNWITEEEEDFDGVEEEYEQEDEEEVDTSRQERSENWDIKQLRENIVDFIFIILNLTDSSNPVVIYSKGG